MLGAAEDLLKHSLQEAIIKFQGHGILVGAINNYIRRINVFLNCLFQEQNYDILLLNY